MRACRKVGARLGQAGGRGHLVHSGRKFSRIVTYGNMKIENITNELVADEISRLTVKGFSLLLTVKM